MADALDLGSSGNRRAGSTPASRTICSKLDVLNSSKILFSKIYEVKFEILSDTPVDI